MNDLFSLLSKICFFLLCLFLPASSDIPAATGWGTELCEKWPTFYLQDFNPNSEGSYLQLYGLSDILPPADITIVGLYYSDSDECQDNAILQEKLGNELQNDDNDIVVHNVILSNYAPLSCALEECVSWWWDNPFMFPNWFGNNCRDYVGGCPPGDVRLQQVNWQGPLANKTTLPIFQDTYWADAWDRFGGGKGDIFIYDGEGRLYEYLCNPETNVECSHKLFGGLANSSTYDVVLQIALEAASSNSTERCGSHADDDFVIFDNYYYDDARRVDDDEVEEDDNSLVDSGTQDSVDDATGDDDEVEDDDESNGKKDDTSNDDDKSSTVKSDDKTIGNVKYEDDDDDDGNGVDDVYTGDDLMTQRMRQRRQGGGRELSVWAYASIFAVVLSVVVSCFVFYRIWKNRLSGNVMSSSKHSGSTGFSRLPTTDPIELQPGGKLNESWMREDVGYGSL